MPSSATTIDENTNYDPLVMTGRGTVDVAGQGTESSRSSWWEKILSNIPEFLKQERATLSSPEYEIEIRLGFIQVNISSEEVFPSEQCEEGEFLLADGSILITDPGVNAILERSREDIKAGRTVPWSQVKRGILH